MCVAFLYRTALWRVKVLLKRCVEIEVWDFVCSSSDFVCPILAFQLYLVYRAGVGPSSSR